MSLERPKVGEELICPVCGKKFKATENTVFIMHNAYTCSWDCFKKEHIRIMTPIWEKRKAEAKAVNDGQRKPRGRKRRTTADDKVDSAYNRMKNALHPNIENSQESLTDNDIDSAVKDAFVKNTLV